MGISLVTIRNKVKAALDLSEETFVSDSEINGYINDGIKEAEAILHQMNEDYFLTATNLALVNGTASYSLPSDMYANKIRKIYYDDGQGDTYEIKPIKDLTEIPLVETYDAYRYILNNTTASGTKIVIYPTPDETLTITNGLWYIRDAKQLSIDADETDIPEFSKFIELYARVQCVLKEEDEFKIQSETALLNAQRELMVSTLSNRTPDGNDEMERDFDFYNDFCYLEEI